MLLRYDKRIVPDLKILTSSGVNTGDFPPSMTWSSDRFTRGVAATLTLSSVESPRVADRVRVPFPSQHLHPPARTSQNQFNITASCFWSPSPI